MAVNRHTILIMEHDKSNLQKLKQIFENDYDIIATSDINDCDKFARQYRDKIAAVLVDVAPGREDGYQTLDAFSRSGLLEDFPAVGITTENAANTESKCFKLGASDIISAPFNADATLHRVNNVVNLNIINQNQIEEIEQRIAVVKQRDNQIIEALLAIVEYISLETGYHTQRIQKFTEALLQQTARDHPEYNLTEDSIQMITSASSMHDIGKLAIPDSILEKPGKLLPSEYNIMKRHTTIGMQIMDKISDRISDDKYFEYMCEISRWHHERWDGNGYPDKLKGDNIPLCAQIVGLADCYDALTNKRCYKEALSPRKAMDMINSGQCGQFSPELLKEFNAAKSSLFQLSADFAEKEKKAATEKNNDTNMVKDNISEYEEEIA